MLKNTFCHIPGIGVIKERRFWDSGIYAWEDLLHSPRQKGKNLSQVIERSFKELERDNAQFFAHGLASNQGWRLFPSFRNSIAYVDIETTGLYPGDSITTIALYDGRSLFHYVSGDNLPDFKKRIRKYKVIVTYNGKTFDVPFMERYFRMRLDCAHIDLRYILRSLGYSGGLKQCEKKLGIRRKGLEKIDGFDAVFLWEEYKRNHDKRALETLLAYNVQDAINLERLLAVAYNKKLKDTPFQRSHRMDIPAAPENPFKPDPGVVRRLRRWSYEEW